MTIKRAALVGVLCMLAMPVGALAMPPAQGQRAPAKVVPTAIPSGYVGPAIIGPRSYCAPSEGTGGICADVRRSSCRLWRRGADGWSPGRILHNVGGEVFWTAPYSGAYHWVWGIEVGYGVVATRCLYRFEPIYS